VNANAFGAVVQQRLATLLVDMAGPGVSPSRRLRLEGYLQAGVEMGLITRQQAIDWIVSAFAAQLGEDIAPDSPILGDPNAEPADIRIPLRYGPAGDADS
jgi:hypothetical protein